ncbi:MAG: NADH-quinone oxidoreductase subunit N [Thermogutta sp.]|nr:NADH-quinone oxidoreductase subunit N [Thermogutta sp.]
MGTALQDMIPELILGMAAAACFLLGAFPPLRRGARGTAWCALIFAGAVAVVQTGWWQGVAAVEPWYAAFNALFRLLGPGLGMIVLASMRADAAGEQEAESAACLLSAALGVILAGGAGDLITLFLGLELISIASYILLYLDRDGPLPQESAGKYFFLSILSSAVLLYGLSYVYGLGGSLRLDRPVHAWADAAGMPGDPSLGAFAAVLVFAGLAFKIAAVPFHFYAPDVYQGTSHANAALLSVFPKAAGMAAVIKLLLATMVGWGGPFWQAVLAVAVLTMTVGNVIALWQTHLRRLLAYSSIAHAGFMLIGLTTAMTYRRPGDHPWDGAGAMLLYLIAYVIATAGAFAALSALRRGDRPVERLDDLRGLARSAAGTPRFVAWSLAAFMFSLAGIPPLAGFWGKLAVFFSALEVGASPSESPIRSRLLWLAVIGAINAAIGAAYYLRVVGALFFTEEDAGEGPQTAVVSPPAVVAVFVCLVLTLAIGVAPGGWFQAAHDASPTAARPTVEVSLGAASPAR